MPSSLAIDSLSPGVGEIYEFFFTSRPSIMADKIAMGIEVSVALRDKEILN